MWDSEINTQLSAEFAILSFPATSNSDVLWHSSLQTNKQTKPTRKQTNKMDLLLRDLNLESSQKIYAYSY